MASASVTMRSQLLSTARLAQSSIALGLIEASASSQSVELATLPAIGEHDLVARPAPKRSLSPSTK